MIRFFDRVETTALTPLAYRWKRGAVVQISRSVMMGTTEYGIRLDGDHLIHWLDKRQFRKLSLLELIAEAADAPEG